MRVIQIIQSAYETPISGADLRNAAVSRALQHIAPVRQFAIGRSGGLSDTARNGAFLSRLLSETPDLVVVEGVALLAWAQALREAMPPATRIVIDFHNVESALLEEQHRARWPKPIRALAPMIHGHRWRAERRRDRAAVALADAIWTCSERDRTLTRALVGHDFVSAVIPNPVPSWCERAEQRVLCSAAGDPRILFVGHLGYAPNKVAVRRLVGRIMPAIARKFPGTRLTVAGRSPNARLRTLLEGKPNVDLVADPADLAPLYRAADMVLVPLSEGGGSRIKVLEAMAIGCPVVATAKAVEGLELETGRHYLAAETTQDFAAAVERLVSEPGLAEGLRAHGLAHVRSEHGPSAITRRVAAAVAEMGLTDAGRDQS